jgi:pimeloyl-ACP methyl ester carboxylesterase
MSVRYSFVTQISACRGTCGVARDGWPVTGPAAKAAPQANRLRLRSEFPVWALRTFVRPILARIADVPGGLLRPLRTPTWSPASSTPCSRSCPGPRARSSTGSSPDVNRYDLEAITVPVLIVHAADDPMVPTTRPAPVGRIPGASLIRADPAATSRAGRKRPSGLNHSIEEK